MAKITLNKMAVLSAMTTVSNYLPKDGDFAGAVNISGRENLLTIEAHNGIEHIVVQHIPFVNSDMTKDNFELISIDGKKFLAVIKAAKSDISIEKKEDYIVVSSGRSRAKIETFAKTQSMKDTVLFSGAINVDGDLLSALAKAVHTTDTNNPKFEFNGVLLDLAKEALSVVSTDTKRLSAISMDKNIGKEAQMILPKNAVSSLIKLFGNSEIILNYDEDETVIMAASNEIRYTTKLISGLFPNWKNIMPNEFTSSVKINKEMLVEMTKEASVFEDAIVVSIKDNLLLMKDIADNTYVDNSIVYEGEPILFSLHSKTILEFADASDGEEVEILFNDHNLPLVLKAGEGHKEVCMPLMIETEIHEATAA